MNTSMICPACGDPAVGEHVHDDRQTAIITAHLHGRHGDCAIAAQCDPPQRTLHLGVTRDQGRWLDNIDLNIMAALPLPDWFNTNGDSFVEWGERLGEREHEALHVTRQIHDFRGMNTSGERDLALRCMDTLERHLSGSWRVVDYVAVTNAGDWSQEAETYGRFA